MARKTTISRRRRGGLRGKPKQIAKLPRQEKRRPNRALDEDKRRLWRKIDAEFARQEPIIAKAIMEVPDDEWAVDIPAYEITAEETKGLMIDKNGKLVYPTNYKGKRK